MAGFSAQGLTRLDQGAGQGSHPIQGWCSLPSSLVVGKIQVLAVVGQRPHFLAGRQQALFSASRSHLSQGPLHNMTVFFYKFHCSFPSLTPDPDLKGSCDWSSALS